MRLRGPTGGELFSDPLAFRGSDFDHEGVTQSNLLRPLDVRPGIQYSLVMANSKRRRPQTQKSANQSTRSPGAMAMILRNGDGPHKSKVAYDRKPKHRNRQEW